MNTKKVIAITACAAVLVGSAVTFRKVKKEVTRILKAEEPKNDEFDCKSKFDGCDVRAEKKYDCCAARNRYAGGDCEAIGDCCEAMSPCEDAEPMGKARLVD